MVAETTVEALPEAAAPMRTKSPITHGPVRVSYSISDCPAVMVPLSKAKRLPGVASSSSESAP